MYTLAEQYKEYDRNVEKGREPRSRNVMKLDPHTFLLGEKKIRCIECGRKTKTLYSFCLSL